MVKSVTSLTQNGLRDWMIQNGTAFFMAVYILALVIYLILNPVTDFYSWHNLFNHTTVRIATFLFLFFLVLHTRIGLWTIATDYLKHTGVRLAFIVLTSLVLIGSLIWAVTILWGA